MFSGRQCTGASTTGRVAQDFGDHTSYRSHDHSPRSPVRPRTCAQTQRRPCLLSTCLQRHSSRLPSALPCQQHSQQQCRQRRNPTCVASSSCVEPSSNKAPVFCRNLRTAALLCIVFGAWCCVSTHTQTSSAFLSITTALTGAGASSAGSHTLINTMHHIFQMRIPLYQYS